MIQYLSGQDKPICRKLWEEAFPEDSKTFCDYYFQEKLTDNRILALVEDNGENGPKQVHAMVHRNPYLLSVKGCRWKVDYLVGVATQKEMRHQGFMRRLLLQVMADMRREQMPFCFLMPAKEAIYRPFGFTYIFRQPQLSLEGEGVQKGENINGDTPDGMAAEQAAVWMNRWLGRHYPGYALRDEAYVRRLAKEIASENGSLALLYGGQDVVGVLGEWGYGRKVQRLLYGDLPYVQEKGDPKPAIMARVISLEAFVPVIRVRNPTQGEMVVRLHLSDPLIPQNDGHWIWHLNGESSWIERAARRPGPEVMAQAIEDGGRDMQEKPLELSISQLTAWLFGYEVPEPALPYAALVEPLQGVFLDEVV